MLLWILSSVSLSFYLLGGVIGRRLRARFVSRLTAVNDLDGLGKERKGGKLAGQAVICGGSIAGLLTARACADHFESVLIVDPEEWIASADGTVDRVREKNANGKKVNPRTRVMQYTHLHLYQAFSTVALKRWYADWEERVRSVKGIVGPADFQVHINGTLLSGRHGDVQATSMTRAAYETSLRKALLERCSNVTWMTGTVTGIKTDEQHDDRIASVIVRNRNGANQTVEASFVADCTGATQAGLKWLQREGFATLPPGVTTTQFRETYDPRMKYTSLELKVDPSELNKVLPTHLQNPDQIGLFLNIPVPQVDKRHVLISRGEANFVHIAVGGWGIETEEIPTSVPELRSYLQTYANKGSFPTWLWPFLDLLERTSESPNCYETWVPPVKFALSYIHYEKLQNIPSNFVAIGDSTMRLNPVRGQGCSKAAIGAVTLNGLLSEDSNSVAVSNQFGAQYFERITARTAQIWSEVKGGDYAYPTTVQHEGDTATSGSFGRWLGKHLLPLAAKDKEVGRVLFEVGQFIAPGTDLFHPRIVGRLIGQVLRSYIHI